MSKMNTWLDSVSDEEIATLQELPISIVDIGSSASPPQNCIDIASISRYIGFDPDLREPQESADFGFVKHTIIDKAVVCSTQENVTFYLTKYPQCSSTLYPNIDEYKNYSVADFFDVIDQLEVPSISLDLVLNQLDLSYIDWLKLDTQGTDYSILRSLDLEVYNKLLVVDLEPGVTSFYRDENRFSDIHEFMLSNGFWLANLNQQRFPRISRITSQKLNLTAEDINVLGGNPFAFELQYFRSIEFLEKRGVDSRDFLIFWVLAMTNLHYAYAIEIAMSAEKFGIEYSVGNRLAAITLSYCQQQSKKQKNSKFNRIIKLFTPPIFGKILSKVNKLGEYKKF